jgi:MIP family channel proteins
METNTETCDSKVEGCTRCETTTHDVSSSPRTETEEEPQVDRNNSRDKIDGISAKESPDVSHFYGCCPPKVIYNIPLPRVLLAELIGTCMIVLFGCGSVCSGLSGAYSGIWQTAVVWGIAVSLAILCTAEISGAHLNPAVSVAFWLVRKDAHQMTAVKTSLYIVAQLLGGVLGGALNLLFYSGTISAFERNNNIVRGDELSILTASAFGEYFPNPGLTIEYGGDFYSLDDVSPAQAVLVEGWGTFVLCCVIFAVTHERNQVLENSCTRVQVPFVIGMTVAMLLALYAPITQAGWNPARDFGPRLVAFMAGWGSVAIPGPRNGFWVYIVGPLVGGPLGAAFMEYFVFGTLMDRYMTRMKCK